MLHSVPIQRAATLVLHDAFFRASIPVTLFSSELVDASLQYKREFDDSAGQNSHLPVNLTASVVLKYNRPVSRNYVVSFDLCILPVFILHAH